MSYDFYICKEVPLHKYSPFMGEQIIEDYAMNYTSNVAAMWREAFCCPDGIKRLNMVQCKSAVGMIDEALICMTELPEVYEKMNPTNKWGDNIGAQNVLVKLRKWCLERPDCYIRIVN